MKLRTVLYGYKMENGELAVSEKESAVVQRVFADYISGKGLKAIADALTEEKIVYHAGCFVWSKNKIDRILTNDKYLGKSGYPPIITYEMFERVRRIKEEKGFKERECTELVEWLKTTVRCGQCGKLLHRDPMWSTREKWFCKCGCKTDVYVSDMEILGGVLQILNRVRKEPELLNREKERTHYERTPEIMRMTNEIGRMADSAAPSYAVGKKLILECAALKFTACREDKASAYTDKVINKMRETAEESILSVSFLKEVAEEIRLLKDGRVTVQFINGAELTSEAVEKNGRKSKKGGNGHTGESVAVETKK